MSNVIEFVKGEDKVLLSKEFLPLYGAVLSNLRDKATGTRFSMLKDRKVFEVLSKGYKIKSEVKQIEEIGKAFTNLQAKGFLTMAGDKVQTVTFNNDCADLAQEVVNMANSIEVSEQKEQVNRNPVKSLRYYLSNGVVTPFGRGKPGYDKLTQECNEQGEIIADPALAAVLRQPAKSPSVKRDPGAANLRYYLKDGVVTPFGRGKPGFDKLTQECNQAGEIIADPSLMATLRQPRPNLSGSKNASKVSQLEAQLAEMREMMAKFAMAVGAGVALPAAAVAVEPPAATAPTEPAKPAKDKDKPKAEKPEKSKGSAPKVEKVKAQADDEDAYEGFASVSGDLADEPISMDSNGFVVTDID